MPTISEAVGRVLGKRYRLVSPLGAGASAHVYLAEDVSLQRQVAVKVLVPGLAADQSFLKRFRAEARTVASLNHPHVLRVFDWGEDADGPYLVMEFLGGGSLREVLDREVQLSHAQATRIGAEAAAGLAYAHSRGLVHRDVKPANLLFDEEQRVRVGDFGVARALAEAAWTEPVGAMVGTARYASPEQAEGRTVDGRADVYSLALVLYESLTGEVPFSADTTAATLMARIGAGLPSHEGLGPLDEILRTAAAPAPDDRYDAAQLAAMLEALASGLPVPAPLPLRDEPVGPRRRAPGTFRAPGTEQLTAVVPVVGPQVAGEGAPGPAGATPPARPVSPPTSPPPLRAGPDEVFDVEAIEEVEAANAAEAASVAAAAAAAAAEQAAAEQAAAEQAAAEQAAAGAPQGQPATRVRELAQPPPVIARRPPRRRRWPWVLGVTLVVAAVVAAGAVVAIQRKLFTPSVRVHALVGSTLTDARKTVLAEHLVLRTRPPVYSTSSAAGLVLRQSVAKGTQVKEGTTVFVTASKGPPPVKVPSLAGVDCPTAQRLLALVHLNGLCPASLQQYSATVPAGQVVSWTYGTHADPTGAVFGAAISMVVSKGHAPVTVPSDLAGGSYDAAEAAIKGAGLVPAQTSAYSTGYPAGQVTGTDPSAGQTVAFGSTVTVTVSLGPPTVAVPDVDGDSVTVATAALENAGLKVAGPYGPGGLVVITIPAAGTEVNVGSTVDLYVG